MIIIVVHPGVYLRLARTPFLRQTKLAVAVVVVAATVPGPYFVENHI
jgi:hypothetical protein